ncbi:MAG TPA: SUMF1/EgtB/PvdO family nonheme iron enzyme [Polyangiaceae bacterium]
MAVCSSCANLTGLSDLSIGNQAYSDDGSPAAQDGGVVTPPEAAPPGPDANVPGDDDSAAPVDGSLSETGAVDSGPPRPDSGAPDSSDSGNPPVSCAVDAGLVSVGAAFCIDATEVTNAQYALFLAANPATSLAPSPACQYKTSFTPSSGWPATSKGTYPVVYVDWCDAYAYCAWTGKHLCGAVGGGPSSKADVANKAVDEWYIACSTAGANVYPYGGNAYVQGKCNDTEANTHGTRPVATFPGCQGGYTGIFDMNGNAYEWEDACDVSAGASDSCVIRGGSWNFSGASYGGCNTYFNDYVVQRSDTYNDTGFRCCAK